MTASPWVLYEQVAELIADGTIDLDDDTFKVQLHTSSYSPDAVNDVDAADLTDEVANGSGYTTGGVTITQTWTRSGGTAKFDSDNPTWTASGGSIVARYAVLIDTTADRLIAYCLLDNTPADVTTIDGFDLVISIHTNGYFQLAV